jgi:hypothetical protein
MGHAFAFNRCFQNKSYERVTKDEKRWTTFIPGQLVFFIPAPTIEKRAKSDHRLKACVFLDYYGGPTGQITGQYIVVPLEDFCDRNLHHRAGPEEFRKIHYHRTEVARHPPMLESEPIFPLRKRYIKCNYDLEGLEDCKHGRSPPVPVDEHIPDAPPMEKPKRETVEVDPDSLWGYKYDLRGRRLRCGPDGKWFRKNARYWIPIEVPDDGTWETSTTEEKKRWKEMFPRQLPPDEHYRKPHGDGKRYSLPRGGTTPNPDERTWSDDSDGDDADLPHLDLSEETDVAEPASGSEVETEPELKAGWTIVGDEWIWTQDVVVHVEHNPKYMYWTTPPKGQPGKFDLTGLRVHRVRLTNGEEMIVSDVCYGGKRGRDPEVEDQFKRMRELGWTGTVHYRRVHLSGTPTAPLLNSGVSAIRPNGCDVVPTTGRGNRVAAYAKGDGHWLKNQAKVDPNTGLAPPMQEFTCPCGQEADNFPELLSDVEKVRSSIEELSFFERAVTERLKKERKMLGKVAKCETDEEAILAGLVEHNSPPRLMSSHDFREDDIFRRSTRHAHRDKATATEQTRLPFNTLVARPVSRSEYMSNPKAMEAYWKEWENLEKRQTWSWDTLTEWDSVASQAKQDDKEIHFGYLFGIMVEKGSEFEPGDPRRYFKFRVVFQGNNVKDQDWQVALFNEMASTPATLEASRISDIYGSFDGHSIQTRDVEQAYLQAKLEGPATYIMLPEELWTPDMYKMKCPVFKLEKALYGHPNSGRFWLDHCDREVARAGFTPVSECWPCVYFEFKENLLLIVYVDDMKISGPTPAMAKAWERLGENLTLEPPKG